MRRTIPALLMLLGVIVPSMAEAGLPNCDHKDLSRRMLSHFNDAQESRQAPRRARKLENIVETGLGPAEGVFIPKNYQSRYCEGDLRLDDNSTVHVFIVAVGVPGDNKAGAEGIETCWSDPRFPRYAEGCSIEVAPSRRK